MKKLALLTLAIAGMMTLGACQSTDSNGTDSGFHKGFDVGGFGGAAVR